MNGEADTLDQLRLIQQSLDEAPMIRFMGIKALSWDAEAGVLSCAMTGRPEMGNMDGANSLHGGAIASFIDTVTIFVVVAKGIDACTTTSLHVDFLRPATTSTMTCIGRLRRLGRTAALVDADVFDDANALVATGRANIALIAATRGP